MAHVEDRWVRKDRSKKPEHGQGLRWRVVWDDGGRRRTKSFPTKDAAQAHLTHIDHAQRSGEYVPARDTKRVLADYWPRLERLKAGRAPKTRQMYANAWNAHLGPVWGHKQVRSIRGPDVAEWLEGLPGSASARVKVKQTLSALLDLAVEDRVIPRNPVAKLRVRPDQGREHIYLTAAQVRDLLEAMPAPYRLLTETLVSTGVRVGEAVELRVGDLDLPRGRIRVSRGWADGVVTVPKSRRSRTVPVPGPLVVKLAAHVEGRDRGELVFTSAQGRRVDPKNYKRRHIEAAAARAGLPPGFRTHDLRHTFTSLALSAGASVLVVQNALGHADATTTLRTYAGLFDTDLDDVATRLGDLLAPAPAEHLDPDVTGSG